MIQYIEFYITSYNVRTGQVLDQVLTKLQDYGDIKRWDKRPDPDSDTLHYTVNGSWAAYSTISTILKSKGKTGDPIQFSLEHFEED